MGRSTIGILALLALVCAPELASAQGIFASEENPSRSMFVPTASLNLGTSWRSTPGGETTNEAVHFSAAAGVAWHPWAKLSGGSPFVAGQLEFEPLALPGDCHAYYFMPMAQLGWAALGCHDELNMFAASLTCFKAYAIGGVRPGMPGRMPSARMGLGINSFFITLAGLHGSAFLPSTFELLFEVDPVGTQVTMFRMGLGF